MLRQPNDRVPGGILVRVLPWLVGAGALLVYLITLNHWVSLQSLRAVAWVSGWTWQPELAKPLTCSLLYPLALLPRAWIPLTLNPLNALCAAAVLVLLARSVILLPHDVQKAIVSDPTPPEPALLTRHAWLPVVLATTLCGLELSFWEQATSFNGEMIDLLLVAGIIWGLLEFRIRRSECWLWGCALAYGAGMANDWALLGLLPVFLIAVFRLKGLAALDFRFVARMALWGLAGSSLYLLLPALHSLKVQGHVDFWVGLKANLKSQIVALSAWGSPALLPLGLALLLPLAVMSIRWKSHSVQIGDDTRVGVFLTKATAHLVLAAFFLCALWLALDPEFSPRHLGLELPSLTFYYLYAMVAGYGAGHFLLLEKPTTPTLLRRTALGVLYLVPLVLGLSLILKNLPEIRLTNGPALHNLARHLYGDLPPGKSVALSDDARLLTLVQIELSAHGRDGDVILVDCKALANPRYLLAMAKRDASRWPPAPPAGHTRAKELDKLPELASALTAQAPVYYLHPSFGLVFERFEDQAIGTAHRLVADQAGQPNPAVEPALVSSNTQIWESRWTTDLQPLAGQSKERIQALPEWLGRLGRFLRLANEHDFTVSFVGATYAKSLNYLGVQVQRLGERPAAGVWFERAVALDPENLCARINLEFNHRWQQGDQGRLDPAAIRSRFADLFSRYKNWAEILNRNGPVDEPTFLFEAGRVLRAGRNDRQAAAQFARCTQLAPNWAEPQLWLALHRIEEEDWAGALELSQNLQASGAVAGPTDLARLLFCRTTALQGLGRTNEAAASLQDFVDRGQAEALTAAAEVFAQNRQFKKALLVLEARLRQDPDQPALLEAKGWTEIKLARYDAADQTLSRALALAPSDERARLYRAVAFLGAGRFEAAREDYQVLLKGTSASRNALVGLGTFAWRHHETNAAIELYEQGLSNALPGSAQYKIASQALNQLREDRGAKPPPAE